MDTSPLSRRHLLALAGGAFPAAALLAACGQSQPSPAGPAGKPTTATNTGGAPSASAGATLTTPSMGAKADGSAGPIGASAIPAAAGGKLASQEIVVACWQSPHAQATKRLAPIFTEITGNKVTVQVETPPDSSAEQAKWLAIAQAQGDDWDVVHIANYNALRYGQAGFFVNLAPELANADLVNSDAYNFKDFAPTIINSYRYKDQQLGLPFEASTLMCFARKDYLQEFGGKEPSIDGYTWEDLTEIGRAVQDKINAKGSKGLYALAFCMDGTQSGSTFQQLVRSFGLHEFTDDENPQPQFNHEIAVTALQTLYDWVFKHKIASPGVTGYGFPEMIEVVNQGQAVITLQWNASAETNEIPAKSQAAGKLAYAAYPYSQTAGKNVKRVRNNSHGYMINPWSKKRDAALEFIAWYTSPDVARDYVTNGGGTSGRSSLLHDQKIVGTHPWYPAMFRGYELFYGYPNTPHFTYLLNTALAKNVTAIFSGQMSVKQGLDKAQEEAVAYLKQNSA